MPFCRCLPVPFLMARPKGKSKVSAIQVSVNSPSPRNLTVRTSNSFKKWFPRIFWILIDAFDVPRYFENPFKLVLPCVSMRSTSTAVHFCKWRCRSSSVPGFRGSRTDLLEDSAFLTVAPFALLYWVALRTYTAWRRRVLRTHPRHFSPGRLKFQNVENSSSNAWVFGRKCGQKI